MWWSSRSETKITEKPLRILWRPPTSSHNEGWMLKFDKSCIFNFCKIQHKLRKIHCKEKVLTDALKTTYSKRCYSLKFIKCYHVHSKRSVQVWRRVAMTLDQVASTITVNNWFSNTLFSRCRATVHNVVSSTYIVMCILEKYSSISEHLRWIARTPDLTLVLNALWFPLFAYPEYA